MASPARHHDKDRKPQLRVVLGSGAEQKRNRLNLLTYEKRGARQRAKTAISWLEEAALLRRDENRASIFPSSLKVRTVLQAEAVLAGAEMTHRWRGALMSIVRTLMAAEPSRGVSTDELAGTARLSASELRQALHDLERLRIAADNTAITAFVHVGIEHSSKKRLDAFAAADQALIDALREAAPDLTPGER